MKPGFEILIDSRPMSRKGKRMLEAMAKWAPPGSCVSSIYNGNHKHLMMYGVGDPVRHGIRQHHIHKGGRVLLWDMGYFKRSTGTLRLTLDTDHPTEPQIYSAPPHGRDNGIELREDADPQGPVLLVGLGKKSLPHLGLRHLEWEQSAIRQLRIEHPGAKIRWRPKGLPYPLFDLPMWAECEIETAMKGCSLVWCRHSNVGIDAIIAGIPLHCEDGAAMALMRRHPDPTPAERWDFIQRLGWFNWSPDEARGAWLWIHQLVSSN